MTVNSIIYNRTLPLSKDVLNALYVPSRVPLDESTDITSSGLNTSHVPPMTRMAILFETLLMKSHLGKHKNNYNQLVL